MSISKYICCLIAMLAFSGCRDSSQQQSKSDPAVLSASTSDVRLVLREISFSTSSVPELQELPPGTAAAVFTLTNTLDRAVPVSGYGYWRNPALQMEWSTDGRTWHNPGICGTDLALRDFPAHESVRVVVPFSTQMLMRVGIGCSNVSSGTLGPFWSAPLGSIKK